MEDNRSHQGIIRNPPTPPRPHGLGGLPAGGGAEAGGGAAAGFVPAGGGGAVPAGGGAAAAGGGGGFTLGGVPLGGNPIHNGLYAAEMQRQAHDAARRLQEQGNHLYISIAFLSQASLNIDTHVSIT